MPYNYNLDNNLIPYGHNPGIVHTLDNYTAHYFRRYLLQKAMSVFKWEMPETWNRDYFLYTLYVNGYIAVLDTPEYGVIPQQCSIRGYNIYYAPKEILVANPLLHTERTIDVDTVLLKLEPDYLGVMDMINYYVSKLAMMSESIDMDLINTKLAYVFTASNKATAESFKKLYDKIASGEPAVVLDKDLLNEDGSKAWDYFSQNLKQNYIVTDLLADMRKIEDMFCTEVGIPNANTEKRERLITDEVNANNIETNTRAALWLESLQAGCKKVNDMFGVKLTVDWRQPPNADIYKEGDEAADESGDDD